MPTLYNIAIPPCVHALSAMAKFLDKGRAYATEQGWDESVLTEARLYEDMGPLTAQVQRASDAAKFVAVRIGGVENVPFADDEMTLDDLQARIAKTIAFLNTATPAAFEGKDEAEVILKLPHRELVFTGQSYLTTFALPNFYFHVTTAYALLRMKGVPVGKLDFLGGA